MFNTIRKYIRQKWVSFLLWFRDSEVILIARIQTFGGIIAAATMSIDWTPLLSMDFSKGFTFSPEVYAALIICAHGLLLEVAKRYRSED